MQRHVRAEADLTAQGRPPDVGREAQPIKADILGINHVVAGRANRVNCPRHGCRTGTGICGVGRTGEVEVGVAAVVVQHVGTKLGVVELRNEPAYRQAELTAVTCILGLGARYVGIIYTATLCGRTCHCQT
ncbi:hypothetical protein D3C84_821880 [compost metagenome]